MMHVSLLRCNAYHPCWRTHRHVVLNLSRTGTANATTPLPASTTRRAMNAIAHACLKLWAARISRKPLEVTTEHTTLPEVCGSLTPPTANARMVISSVMVRGTLSMLLCARAVDCVGLCFVACDRICLSDFQLCVCHVCVNAWTPIADALGGTWKQPAQLMLHACTIALTPQSRQRTLRAFPSVHRTTAPPIVITNATRNQV